MDKLKAMEVFIKVVETGSQVAASEQMDLSRPAVSRYLAELEEWMGTRLLHRTTRKLSLTAAGSEVLNRCRAVLEQVEQMQAAISTPLDAVRGQLRITASASFVQAQLAQVVAEFVQRYPQVTVDLLLLDKTVNLVEERIDLALRITNDLDPNLIARPLTICRSVLCASPQYLQQHGAIHSIQELAQRNCLTHTYHTKSLWYFNEGGEENGAETSVAVSGNLSTNETSALMQATLAGAGIAMLPTYLAMPYLKRGELLTLLPQAKPRELKIYAIFATRKHMPPALRALLDFLVEKFPSEPSWDQ